MSKKKKKENMELVTSVITHAAYDNFDPLGMYTGNFTLVDELKNKPIQDADDL